MALTNERAEALAGYLKEDIDRAKRLVDLTAEEAVAEINKDGNDFTVEEIKDFAEQMQSIAASQDAQGELGEDALNNVAGGVVISGAVLGAGVALFSAGVSFGYTVARDRGW